MKTALEMIYIAVNLQFWSSSLLVVHINQRCAPAQVKVLLVGAFAEVVYVDGEVQLPMYHRCQTA